MKHAKRWTALDTRHPDALFALGDAQTALGQQEAMETYASVVDVRPWSRHLHARLAEMYRNKGDARASCAHRWSMMSLYPKRVQYHIDLALCLANIPGKRSEALRILSRSSRNAKGTMSRKIARALAPLRNVKGTASPRVARVLASLRAQKRKRRMRRSGAIVLEVTWNQPIDLDVALVTPRGERITAVRGSRRGGTLRDSRDGRSSEILALRWAHDGLYRIEIAPGPGAHMVGPVSGTLRLKARGKTKTRRFELPAPGVLQLAALRLKTVIRPYYGYY